MANFPAVTIKNFKGLNTNEDALSAIPGQLQINQNLHYMLNGGLEERGGGARLNTPPAAGVLYSLANYKNNSGTEYLITNQGTDIYYENTGWNALSLTLTADKKIRWEEAGFSTNRAIYGVNENESIIRVSMSGASVVATTLTTGNGFTNTSPTDLRDIKLHKNRLFAINKDTLYFTDALDFNEWPSANNIKVYPGVDGFCQKLEIWGDALFIFKEKGVFVLPNAADSDPTTNWQILKTDAKTGTQSPDSVVRTQIGICYYSFDDRIRLIGPTTTYSSSEYTLGQSGSPVISHDIEDDINSLVDRANKSNIQGHTFEDKYLFSFQSVNNGSSYNDLTYFADLTKFNTYKNIPINQPYWGKYTGFNYNYFAVQTSSGRNKLYGAKGTDGEVHEILNDTIHNDNGAAIVSRGALNWFAPFGEEILSKLMRVVFTADTEDWSIELLFNGYQHGNVVPDTGTGVSRSYTTNDVNGAGIVGSAAVGNALIGANGQGSTVYKLNIKGNYFTLEFKNENADEFIRIDKVTMYFKKLRSR